MRLYAALVGLALVLGTTGCGADDAAPAGPVAPEAGTQTWDRVGAMPLSPRMGPVVAWTGTEVLVVGGDVGDPCPAGADCPAATEAARDGAALDPATGTWREIAPAPVSLAAYARGAFVEGHLFVPIGSSLLDYDVAADRWRTLPQRISPWLQPVADGGRLLLVSSSDEQQPQPDRVYDVAREHWSVLPADPIGPAFDRAITPTPHGLVLTAQALVPSPGSDGPSVVLAAVLDRASGRWKRLPDSDVVGGYGWAWTGARVVNPTLGSEDGGKVGNYGREVPRGGRLDPRTGTWSGLPDPPDDEIPGWPVDAAGDRLVASSGWVYDDTAAEDHWRLVPRPRGAAENPGPAVWGGDTLYVVGSTPQAPRHPSEYDLDVWSWRPPLS